MLCRVGAGHAVQAGGSEALDRDQGSDSSGELSSCPVAAESWGEFRVVREISRGGMGIVCEAYQGSLNRHVALKLLPEQGDLARLRREAHAAGRLRHTNIVPVFGVGEQQGRHFDVMQYITGRGLDAVLKELADASGARVGHREAARIGVQVALALADAHGQGVIHRDIKPSNLLLDGRDTVWVTDFGPASCSSGARSRATHGSTTRETLCASVAPHGATPSGRWRRSRTARRRTADSRRHPRRPRRGAGGWRASHLVCSRLAHPQMAVVPVRAQRTKPRRLTISAVSSSSRLATVDLGLAILYLVADAIKPLEILALDSNRRQRERVVRESETEFSGEVSCLSLEGWVEVTSRFEITCVAHPIIGDPHAIDQSLEG